MRLSRLYLPHDINSGEVITLGDENAHYLRAVLRLKKNALITLFNDQAGEFSARVIEISRKQVVVLAGNWCERNVESSLKIVLGLAISRADRMDLAVQKAVELGVYSIEPLISERTLVRFKGDKKKQKMQHWQNITRHAAGQSGRTEVPHITEPMQLPAWVGEQSGLKIFLDPAADCALPELSCKNSRVTLLSGPEGGFSEQERELAKISGFIPVKLGPRILRTETAAIAALAAVQLLWGDFK